MCDKPNPTAAALTLKPDFTLTTTPSAYTTPVHTPVPSPVATTSKYIFNMESGSVPSTPKDQVQKLLDAEDLIPVLEPTVIDVCTFQEALANALAQCTSAMFFEENVIHSFLIESLINYQACTGATMLPEWLSIPAVLSTAPDTL